ncbi:lipid-binding SYLF domain-containing protein [Komagataeibacter sp. FNDCR2]|uniref:lipid-binding SYLF domain-containing protein n=1 Tax=Komagataeibacter sp. FNDCR2 TaxID=2878682 RepID=UPI001E435E23|nr:lipid-binding SYLF domain-containing protein [Komagataeibacter sp. FNDCR2]MCE2573974.1 lipid-binding SYLF domain-containing protein [Komagataeibacter sp. FNDCR2]
MGLHKFHLIRTSLAALALMMPLHAALAASMEEEQNLVDRATLTVRDMFSTATADSRITHYLADARGAIVCPSVFRMSIAFGGGGGGCVFLTRDAHGSWSDPAFYRMSSANFGLQLGMQDVEVMLFVMTDQGVQSLLDSQFKLSADIGTSFASSGSGLERGTAGEHNTSILGVQKSKGLFAGAALGGSKMRVNSAANRAYYNQIVGPEDIVISMRVNNSGADPLRAALSEVLATAQSRPGRNGQAATTTTAPATQAQPMTPAPTGTVTSQSLPPQ